MLHVPLKKGITHQYDLFTTQKSDEHEILLMFIQKSVTKHKPCLSYKIVTRTIYY